MTSNDALTPSQREMVRVWEEHMSSEFVTKDTEATLVTMVPDAYVNHVPVMTGGVGLEQARAFYSEHFITKMPPDTETVLVSRTVGVDQIVDELIFKLPTPRPWIGCCRASSPRAVASKFRSWRS